MAGNRLLFTFLAALLIMSGASAQSDIRGTISDADTGRPLVGATIYIAELQLGADTDTLGRFRFPRIGAGRYTLETAYLGYTTQVLAEVLHATGKETVLNIALESTSAELATVTVRALGAGSAPTPHLRQMSQEETLRFPATFLDPARLSTAYPGTVSANDQANHLIIRGQSPLGVNWRLEGLEIVNPNHTPNAGTFSDLSTSSGGGVNAVSAQLLQSTDYYLGWMPARLGNATSGLLDMRLRNGNNEHAEYTLQAGLIGLDAAAEGPLGKRGGASYLANYRYSFTGLLSDLGVPLGNEDIRFQDLSVKFNLPKVAGGELALFGMLGASKNDFTNPADTAEWAIAKDTYEYIRYKSDLYVGGLTWQRAQGLHGRWSFGLAVSEQNTNREANDSLFAMQLLQDATLQRKLSSRLAWRTKLRGAASLELGTESLLLTQSWASNYARYPVSDELPNDGLQHFRVVSPYAQVRLALSKLDILAALRGSFYHEQHSGQSDVVTEPRLQLNYRLSQKWSVGADAGTSSQVPSVYEAATLPRIASQVGAYSRWHLTPTTQTTITAYYQHLRQIPGQGTLSALHGFDLSSATPGLSTEGRNTGLEASLQRSAGQGWWYLLSASSFDARYLADDGSWQKGRYAMDYALALTLGRERSGTNRKDYATRLGFNLGARLNGGVRELPIDEAASKQINRTVWRFNEGFSQQLPAYFRADLRVYFQVDRPTWNSTLSLDIQNVSGQQNAAYLYYDRFLQGIATQYQLEFIPIISYRVNI